MTSELADHPAMAESGKPTPVAARTVPWGATWVLLISGTAVLNAGIVFSSHRGFFLPMLSLAVAGLAALFDAQTQRIPNPLTYGAILAGLGLNAAAGMLPAAAVTWLAPAGWSASLAGFGAGAIFLILAPLLFPRALHGGDLKLLTALGSMLGLAQIGNVLLLALVFALVYAVINLIAAGRLNWVFRMAAHHTLELVYLRRFPVLDESAPTATTHIPMGIPLALGMLATLCVQLRFGTGALL